MARPRKPSHLKLVTGTARADRMNPNEPKPVALADLAPPPSMTTRATNAWRKLAPLLQRMGVLTEADTLALMQLCEAYAEILSARAALRDRGGPTYETTTVQGGRMVRTYPEVAMLADADRRFLQYLAAFGLTPASRSKVSANPDAGKDPLAEYFGG